KVEQDEDDHHPERNQYLQARLGADLVLPLAGPGHVISRGKFEILFQYLFGLGHEAPHVAAADVKKDQRAQEPPFAVDLGSAGGYFQPGYHRERHLGTLHACDQDTADGGDIVAIVAQVADPDRETVTPLHGGGKHLAPESGLDDILDVADIDAVAGGGLAIDIDVDIVAACDPFGHYVGRAGDRLQDRLGLNRQ